MPPLKMDALSTISRTRSKALQNSAGLIGVGNERPRSIRHGRDLPLCLRGVGYFGNRTEAWGVGVMEKILWGKYDYQKAKKFLEFARVLNQNCTPTNTDTRYEKDGRIFYERESHLEAPRDDYSLIETSE